ncbi:hypothetical protein [Streptomyces sp. NPDC048338]|uniref:hypothetical protein n=1 Tax=Streptomyces sp. NPDC048338 TaxID=3365536 RepID=UPI003711F685
MDHKTRCGGAVVMILRHDSLVGQVWIVEEVCAACAPLIPHARVIARATPDRPAMAKPAAAHVPASTSSGVPSLFFSACAALDAGRDMVRRTGARRPHRRPRQGS